LSDLDANSKDRDSGSARLGRVRGSEGARLAVDEGPLARIAETARARAEARIAYDPMQLRRGYGPLDSRLPDSNQVPASREPFLPPSQSGNDTDEPRDSQDSTRYLDSVTRLVAVQQELDTIRRTLQEKERLVEATAAQCRLLEDELEDQRLAYDRLKQDLERKKLALAASRDLVARASGERDEIEARYVELKTKVEQQEAAKDSEPRRSAARPALHVAGGTVMGILLSATLFGVWMMVASLPAPDATSAGSAPANREATPERDRGAAGDLARQPDAAAPSGPGAQGLQALPMQPVAAQGSANQVTPAQGTSAGEAAAPVAEPAVAAEVPQPVVLRTVHDRLSDGSVGPLMLLLQGGKFVMGRQQLIPGEDEGPAREVRIDDFLIGATEVTFKDYDRFVEATGYRPPHDFGWGRGARPVVDVSWDDARAYTAWLSASTGKSYRLPSEAEWEYAAGARRRSSYWWGYDKEVGRAVCFDCGTRWDNVSTAPVGTFGPNPLGLYDTAGNVMEWVEDCYHPDYQGAPATGRPWVGEECAFRVTRGGAYNKPARSMHTTARTRFDPGIRIDALGFRLARDE